MGEGRNRISLKKLQSRCRISLTSPLQSFDSFRNSNIYIDVVETLKLREEEKGPLKSCKILLPELSSFYSHCQSGFLAAHHDYKMSFDTISF